MKTKTITTLKYGELPIAYSNKYLLETIDAIEDCQGNCYDIRYTFNNQLVAYENNH